MRWYDAGTSAARHAHQPRLRVRHDGLGDVEPQRHRGRGLHARRTTAGHSGSYHLTHWNNGSPFEVWTYQVASGLPSGNYKVRAWVRKGGAFDIARIQAKTCGGCAPVYTDLGTYGAWTLVETPAISVTGGSLELGFHTRRHGGQRGQLHPHG